MYSGVITKPNMKDEACLDDYDSFRDKRRLLSYWKSLGCSFNAPVEKETGANANPPDPLVELRKCLTDLDDFDTQSETTNVSLLLSEQLNLLKQLEGYSTYLKEKRLDLNENRQSDEHTVDALKPERKHLLEENEKLLQQMEKMKKEYMCSSEEQQKDIEKLTREVQSFNISRRKLERELTQIKKQKNDNDTTITTLRDNIKAMKDSYEAEMQRLGVMNDQVSKENSELVEKGKEATEGLKVALQQLTEEKKSMHGQRKSSSGKDIRDVEASLERAKKEREAFRQRCEKSEILQRSLQEEVSSLKLELQVKEKQLSRRSYTDLIDGWDALEKPAVALAGGEIAQSRIAQIKRHVNVLEERIKEKHVTILSLKKENARANDIAMEKSLELSKTRRLLERKIEKLTKENCELKKKLTGSHGLMDAGKGDAGQRREVKNGGEISSRRQRRRSNPERYAIETTLNNKTKSLPDCDVEVESKLCQNQIDKSARKDSEKSTLNVPPDIAPKRRIGGRFIRASSNRHSADLGRLMSRPEHITTMERKSDMLHEDEPSTIFVNKYRKSEEEEHWV